MFADFLPLWVADIQDSQAIALIVKLHRPQSVAAHLLTFVQQSEDLC